MPRNMEDRLSSFCTHMSLLRPLEIIFRYCTYRWRVLPDIIVLGEVRCGTTSFCDHLSKLHSFDVHTPFCLWAHPELDRKETFYFVGHYLGDVTPKYYRMCFPLKITKWWINVSWKIRKLFHRDQCSPRPFLTFDGCAQYLTSPSAPYLIAEAYREAGEPPPIFVACVRDAKEQAISWWIYENNAMAWGEGMGLVQNNIPLRGKLYPPKSLNDAVEFGTSEEISNLFVQCERLFPSQYLIECSRKNRTCILPDWAMSWPGGQLAGIGRNAEFVDNIIRYEKVVKAVATHYVDGKTEEPNIKVNILPLKYLSHDTLLRSFLVQILVQASQRKNGSQRKIYVEALRNFKSSCIPLDKVRRNPNPARTLSSQSNNKLSKAHEEFFKRKTRELSEFCEKRGIRWM